MELKDTTAIVTGSGSPVGCAIAKAAAAAGCNCVCHYNQNMQAAEKLVEQIKKLGVKALAIKADLRDPEQIEALFDKAQPFGPAQVLINSAAVFSRQRLADITFEKAQEILNLNLVAPILTSRAFAEILNAKFPSTKSVVGKIVNIADIGGISPWGEYVLYCSSKAGLIGATKALAKELAPRICVNSVAPGVVTWPSDFDQSQRQFQLSLIPAGRIAEPNEVARAVIFLLENDYITGQVLNVDGGRCI